jgi:CBS domain containing-hemolysin-like protein
MWIVFVSVMAVLTLCAVGLQRTYSHVPLPELKRRARKGEVISVAILKATNYGPSLRAVLWGFIIACCSGFFVVVSVNTAPFAAFLLSATLLYLGFVWLPASRVTARSEKFAAWIAPYIVSIVDKLHPLIDRMVKFVHKHRPVTVHTGMYVRDDLVELLDRQSVQADNRIEQSELGIARHALTFGDKTISHIMTPLRVVKSVSAQELVGPILFDELHQSGHSRFPVFDGKTTNIVGTLFLRDLVGKNVSGIVGSHMVKSVYYIHEDQSIDDALQAILKTHHQLFIVVNNFEELVGIVTMEDVIETVIGKLIVDEFDQYDDLRAVAARHAKLEHTAHKEPIKPEAPLAEEKPNKPKAKS